MCIYINEPVKTDKLIKLANQSNEQIKGAVTETTKKTTILSFRISWSFEA